MIGRRELLQYIWPLLDITIVILPMTRLAEGDISTAVSLYRQSGSKQLKTALKLASSGNVAELLSFLQVDDGDVGDGDDDNGDDDGDE